MAPKLVVCVGSYDKKLFAFETTTLPADGERKKKLPFAFGSPSHDGAVRCMAVSGHLLVTGSTDESVRFFDLKKRVECGQLLEHTGPVQVVQFIGKKGSLLASCSDDGSIKVYEKEKGWDVIADLMPKDKHGKEKTGVPVVGLAVHPSGKVALSIGKNDGLRLWDLHKGICAQKRKVLPSFDRVAWLNGGEHFIMFGPESAQIMQSTFISTAMDIKLDTRISCVHELKQGMLAVGDESGVAHLYDIANMTKIGAVVCHASRLKDITPIMSFGGRDILATISSLGEVRVWDAEELIEASQAGESSFTEAVEPLLETSSPSRLLTLAMVIIGAEEGAGGSGGMEKAKKEIKKAKKSLLRKKRIMANPKEEDSVVEAEGDVAAKAKKSKKGKVLKRGSEASSKSGLKGRVKKVKKVKKSALKKKAGKE
uniref:Uncharacterized protein n=1 Tax=Palpitomonas bilix TaxID=652834 RepID=A0A7S3LT25_9EUKA|mmetsp:Transcript_44160/g.114804  ORF Transcript_44160/g.114804 Transcript_44160/m.114804 type:complete len:425 (+) Transcript_44160:92-1366(+)